MSEREKAWKTRELKLGSLFDGSGGFPLAGALNGIKPVWASEIEPFPIRVTKARFPSMKHLGDVTKINGAEIESVDIITFGSPCQDLSVAGKQMGIHEGQRSSLFFQAIRIIKEMREHDRATGRADDDVRPRFAVWENVPGAFSSNKGADFQAVLQAFCDIEGSGITVPMPPKGKWNPAGCIVGDGFSVAWRVYDAQFWGVAQRRKRIYLIADFGSERAGEILFEREGLHGNPAEGRETWQGTAADAEGSAGRSCAFGVDCYNQTLTWEKSIPIRAAASDADHIGEVCFALEGNTIDRASSKNGKGYCEGVSPTAAKRMNEVCCLNDQGGSIMDVSDKAMTLRAQEHGHQPIACYAVDCRNMQANEEISSAWKASSLSVFENHSQDSRYTGPVEISQTVSATFGMGGNNQPFVVERKTDG